MIDAVIDPETLTNQAGLGMAERAALIQSKFDLEGFGEYHLRQLYYKYQISLKKVWISKVLVVRDLQKQLIQIRGYYEKLMRIKSLGYLPVFIDEIMFTTKSNQTHTWAARHRPIMID